MKNETEANKPWVKPQLTIMVRSKPEEAVLHACKTGTPRRREWRVHGIPYL